MDEQVVRQVELLASTMKLAIDRLEQAFQLLRELTADSLAPLAERLTVLEEALRKSLSESDGQLDDQARIVAGLLLLQKKIEERDQMEQQQQASQ